MFAVLFNVEWSERRASGAVCAICGQGPVSFRSCVGINNLSLTTKVLLCVAEGHAELGQKLILCKYAHATKALKVVYQDLFVYITFNNTFCLKGAAELFYST